MDPGDERLAVLTVRAGEVWLIVMPHLQSAVAVTATDFNFVISFSSDTTYSIKRCYSQMLLQWSVKTESYKVYKLQGPQRQGVESCRILSRPGSVKHLK